ncbi:hypothetical protein [Stenotrophomonas maltophilia]|uniref:hypothetical protein n=1 Tax=Stenotrophomonas maltophilia TaxID=40324 RepID=UPI003D7CE324
MLKNLINRYSEGETAADTPVQEREQSTLGTSALSRIRSAYCTNKEKLQAQAKELGSNAFVASRVDGLKGRMQEAHARLERAKGSMTIATSRLFDRNGVDPKDASVNGPPEAFAEGAARAKALFGDVGKAVGAHGTQKLGALRSACQDAKMRLQAEASQNGGRLQIGVRFEQVRAGLDQARGAAAAAATRVRGMHTAESGDPGSSPVGTDSGEGDIATVDRAVGDPDA